MRVAAWIERTSSPEPRGMTTSMLASSASSAATAARPSTSVTTVAGCASPARASRRQATRTRFDSVASRPPLSSTPLPVARASEPIWITASGRLSKITSSTPSGQLTRVSSSPSSSRVRLRTPPSGSCPAASCSAPSRSVASFAGDRTRRSSRAAPTPADARRLDVAPVGGEDLRLALGDQRGEAAQHRPADVPG